MDISTQLFSFFLGLDMTHQTFVDLQPGVNFSSSSELLLQSRFG
jgi:hypothetical protein